VNFLFAWRYFKAKKSTNAINIIAWISILAMSVGTAALILVLSVFNGFEDLVKSLYSSFYADMKISPVSGKQIILTEAQLNKLRSVNGVNSISLVIEEKAMLVNGEHQSNAYLKGVDENYSKVSGVSRYMIKGVYDVGDSTNPKLVLGAGVENAIGLQSDRNIAPLMIYTGRKGEMDMLNPIKNVSSATANTSGAFIIEQEFDTKYAITNLAFMRILLDLPADHYSSAEIDIDETADPGVLQEILALQLGNKYSVQTRYQQNSSLYAVMQAEKWVIYAILSLILVVAAFNMIGALTMLVLEKKEDIKVLQALGATKKLIQNIFLDLGLLLGLVGGGIGMLIAFIIAWLQIHYKLIPLQGGSFLIDYFPVKLEPKDFALVAVTILVIALLASLIPARKAANQQLSLRDE
jgi:lipoprotein-releasing system permease protein